MENTANRTAKVTAGEFAVVKTGDNLNIRLTGGNGTQATTVQEQEAGNRAITQKTNYVLTDASVDHRDNAVGGYVTIPNTARSAVLNTYPVPTATEAELQRGAATTLSAFTWDMQFTVSFSSSSTKKQGLFLDLEADDTYMHEVINLPSDHSVDPADITGSWFTDADLSTAAEASAANYYEYTATAEDAETENSAVGWFTNPECTTDGAGAMTAGTHYYKKSFAGKLYQAVPDASGKGFRIAFIPTATTNSSVGYAKVWGANDTEGKYVNNVYDAEHPANPADVVLNQTAYSETTISYDGSDYASVSAGTNVAPKVFMGSGVDDAVPNDLELNITTALSGKANYLGYFNCVAGSDVSITFKCVAWFDGTHSKVVSTEELETMVTSMRFEVRDLEDLPPQP